MRQPFNPIGGTGGRMLMKTIEKSLLAGIVGFEPTTCRLTAESSTVELYSQMVVVSRLELPTSRLSGERSYQLSYTTISFISFSFCIYII